MSDLRAESFDPYFTSVGGSGLGVLSPYDHGSANASLFRGPVTPPQTPSPSDVPNDAKPLREQFGGVPETQLNEWANGQGRWLYV